MNQQTDMQMPQMPSMLDAMREREAKRYSRDILDPVQVNSLPDIQRIVASFDPVRNPPRPTVIVRSNMLVNDVDSQIASPPQMSVTAESHSKSKRDLLIEGLDKLKKQIAVQEEIARRAEPVYVNGKPMMPAKIRSGEQAGAWVDPLIRQWTGGYRDGILICWDINDGYVYRYNIYEHRLTRIKKSDRPTTTTAVGTV